MTIPSLLQAVRDALEGGLPEGVAPVAAFDADGTIWEGDIGESAFSACCHLPLLKEARALDPLVSWAANYGLQLGPPLSDAIQQIDGAWRSGLIFKAGKERGKDEREVSADFYAMNAWVFAGCHEEEVRAFGDQIFREQIQSGLLLETLSLIDALRSLPLDVVVVSASHEELASAGATHLGFTPEQVHGMRPKKDEGGRYRPEMERSTYGPGKVEILREKWGGRPLLAAGDSVAGTDRELLAAALLPVAVNPRGAHHEAALAHPSMRVLHARPNPKEAPA